MLPVKWSIWMIAMSKKFVSFLLSIFQFTALGSEFIKESGRIMLLMMYYYVNFRYLVLVFRLLEGLLDDSLGLFLKAMANSVNDILHMTLGSTILSSNRLCSSGNKHRKL